MRTRLKTGLLRAAVGAAALAVAVGAVLWAGQSPSARPTVPIADQWIQAVSQFGLEPVYPPQEDFLVGDILAVITDDAAHDISLSPLPTRALKLMHVDMTHELEAAYSITYQFPASSTRPPASSEIWTPQIGTESIFKLSESPRTSLPIAMLPSFSVRANRLADVDVLFMGATLGMKAQGTGVVELKVDGVETYGISALPAQTALWNFCNERKTQIFCTSQGLRAQLSQLVGQKIFDIVEVGDGKSRRKSPRYSVELALVNRVYLVRSVETIIETSSEASMTGSRRATPPEGATPAPKHSSSASTSSTVGEARGSTISIAKTLARPIVIGYRSVKWRVAE